MSGRMKWAVGAILVGLPLCFPAAAPAVFPGENGKIAYVSGAGGPPNDDSSADVFILDRAGDASPTQLTTADGQHRHPAWSPDLKAIAYARWLPNNEKIFIDFLDDPAVPQLRVGPHDSTVRDDRPAWSPDGTMIAYESEVTDASGQMDIMVANIDTGASFNLTATPASIEGKPVWSRDGETIYYSRRGLPPATDDDILREPADNSGIPEFVTVSATAEYQPGLSPTNDAMCFTRGPFGSSQADVFTLQPITVGGTETDLSDSTAGAYNCAYSPEGDKIAYVDGVFTSGVLMYEDAGDTGTATPLTPDVLQHFDGNPDWAPKEPAFCQGEPATIAGTDGPDQLFGTSDADVVQGHGQEDSIKARGGDDRACGAERGDTLKGAQGDDILFGDAGNDVLNGGPGDDTCRGGPGKDVKKNC